MRWGIILAFALAGCSEPESAKIERQLAMMEKAGASRPEICAKKLQLADAYLREENREEYKLHKTIADQYCASVSIDRQLGL